MNYLLGDWSFALWDNRKQELFIARDRNGISGIYYYANARFIAFASSIKGLLSLSEVPRRLNEQRLAQILVIYPDPRINKNAQLYSDVLSLPPAHCLTVTEDRLEVEEYWRLEDTPKTQLGSDDEYVEAFLELYSDAVQCRLKKLSWGWRFPQRRIRFDLVISISRESRKIRYPPINRLHFCSTLRHPSFSSPDQDWR